MHSLEGSLKGYKLPTQVLKTFLMGPECNISFTHKQHMFLEVI